jgi:hypothetical protein
MRKTMSTKQLAANRRNAQKSTGPQTSNGQAVSKMNAFKHGIYSRDVLVRGKHARESARELRALHARFWEHYKPMGPVEEMLVDQIVAAHWRLRRALKAESGEIALNVDGGQWEREHKNPALICMLWESYGDPVFSMRESALGNRVMENQLNEVRASVEKEGELTEAAIQSAVKYNGKPYGLTEDLEKLRSQLQSNPEGLEAAALRAKQKERALAFIDRKLNLISWSISHCEEHEENEAEARRAAAVLPSPEVLDKIMRYATFLERQLYRAMNQLERVQRMRLGEAVPPPLTMEVSERN